jgi:murein DD-endopeptidase MepM/ murein hydrolase activator NlpD
MKKYFAETLFVIIALVVILLVLSRSKPEREPVEGKVPEVILAPKLKFGLPVDSFFITEGKIKRNQNLSDILTQYGVGLGTIDKLARSSRDSFDVRKIKAGQTYFVFQSPDSMRQAEFFIYESSNTGYVVFQLNDSLLTYFGEKDVQTRLKMAAGSIESSLWNSMTRKNLSPVLALDMSDIYAWTIDFFGIQKGDKFKVFYDEEFVEGKPIGIGTIHAVQFNHMGKDNFAFLYNQNGKPDYFDEEGKNLRKAFLKAPLRFSRISSRFSYSRMHPVLRIRRPHLGVDYAAPRGTPVQSIGDGVVIKKAYQKGGGGNYLRIKHNSVYTTTYMHLSGYARGIRSGSRVRQGDVIGYVGSTGLASGPHLDFRITKNGHAMDPLKVKAPPGDSVKVENLVQYFMLKDSLMNKLQELNWE